jgi:[acyl-carrier-protein] S-malonyltransferase
MRDAVLRDAPDLLAAVVEVLGADPFEQVESTLHVQPAVFCASVASWRRSRSGLRPTAIAGHSLGELAALVAAGAISELDGVRLVIARARACDRAARGSGGGMIALGVDAERGREIAARCGAHLAADNAPSQTVLSGSEESLRAVARIAAERSLRHKRLAISGPFHSPLMASALEPFAAQLQATAIGPSRHPVFSGMTAAPFTDVRRELLEGLTRPVRWRELLLRLHRAGIASFAEAAPGKVLCGLARKTLTGVATCRLEQGEFSPARR